MSIPSVKKILRNNLFCAGDTTLCAGEKDCSVALQSFFSAASVGWGDSSFLEGLDGCGLTCGCEKAIFEI